MGDGDRLHGCIPLAFQRRNPPPPGAQSLCKGSVQRFVCFMSIPMYRPKPVENRASISYSSPYGATASAAARELIAALQHGDIFIRAVVFHKHHALIRLCCGATLSVYHAGKVLVQGKFLHCSPRKGMEMLKPFLPADNTVWEVAGL
jgi:hypothetical protein